MICPLHPEWSAPCSVNRIYGGMYGIALIIIIILAIIASKMLKKVKKKIENEYVENTPHCEQIKEKSEQKKKRK